MSNFAKAILGLIILVLLVAGLSYWGQKISQPTADTVEVETGPIKIGFIGPLTGDAVAYGEPARNMMSLAVEEINNAGGVNGRMLEMIYEDGKCTGLTSSNAAQKLINVDGVKVLTTFCSGETLSVVPIAEGAKVLLTSSGASTPDLTGKSQFFFRNYPSDATQGMVLAQYASEQGWKKVAVIQEQSDYALGNYQAFSENFEKLGGETVKEEFLPNATDFRSSLTKLKGQNPDALFVDPQTPANGERILRQLKDLNWKPKLLVNDALSGDPKTVANNKDILEGAAAAEFGVDPDNEKFQKMLASYKAKYGEEPPFQSYAQTEYDMVYLIADGVRAVGTDGEKLASWSRTIKDWSGASGLVTIGANGDRAGGHVLKVIKNGKTELAG
ncbi:ABC transporter substrate-binding protein [Candidatus Nomurabacteria bacterium]|nr:ABC transporter substrate-binding protein [Candidatus Nomurabacteria bacterium]